MLTRTSLTPFAAQMRDPDPEQARKVARRLWHEHGIVAVMPGDCEKLDAVFVEAIGVRLYGRRRPCE